MNFEDNANKLLIRAKNGDSQALSELIVSNEGLIRYCIRQLNVKVAGYTDEDLMQEGRIKLMNAAMYFKVGKSAKFSTYAYHCLRNHYLELMEKQPRNELFYENFIGKEEDRNYMLLMEAEVEDPEEKCLQFEFHHWLLAHQSLSDYEKDILSLKLKDAKNKEIAEELGKNAASIDTAWCVLKKKIRKITEEYENGN